MQRRRLSTAGLFYHDGNGFEKDEAKAVEWYRRAAEQGYVEGQLKLGECYHFGEGVEKDVAKAVEWYQKAMEQNCQRAWQYINFICEIHPEVLQEEDGVQIQDYLAKLKEKEESRLKAFDVKQILAKAEEAEEKGNVNFFGFYLGMPRNHAEALALHYGLESNEWRYFDSKLWFSLKSVRRITKGGNSAEELAQAVANKVGTLKKANMERLNSSTVADADQRKPNIAKC